MLRQNLQGNTNQLKWIIKIINFLRFVSANLQVNKFKNRLVNILPFESSRVCLQPLRGIEGSDYINASFIDGYRYRNAYIATQGPLNETVEDFWRMLWEHNSTIVVMLTKLREMGRVCICLQILGNQLSRISHDWVYYWLDHCMVIHTDIFIGISG